MSSARRTELDRVPPHYRVARTTSGHASSLVAEHAIRFTYPSLRAEEEALPRHDWGGERQQPHKPQSWATPARFFSSPLSLCSISSYRPVRRDLAYLWFLRLTRSCRLIHRRHSVASLSIELEIRGNRTRLAGPRRRRATADLWAHSHHRSTMVRGLGRRRRRATPCIWTPLRRRDLRTKRQCIAVFSDSILSLQASTTLPQAGISR